MNEEQFLSALSKGITVLTPNRRLSNVWQYRYAQQNKLPNTTGIKPNIYPLKDWCQLQWNDLSLSETLPILLSDHQQRYLWHSIIEQSPLSHDLMDITALAETAQSAWKNIHTWQVNIKRSDFNDTEETQAFYTWMNEYHRRCQQLNACDDNQVPHHLINSWDKHNEDLPSQIILFAFSEFTPIEQELINALEQYCEVLTINIAGEPGDSFSTVANDDDEELTALANWAKSQNKEHTTACVIPNLSEIEFKVRRVFAKTFSSSNDYNISTGHSLATEPLVATAIDLLSLEDPIDIKKLGRLLNSSFIQFNEQSDFSRAQLYKRLLEMGLELVPLDLLKTQYPEFFHEVISIYQDLHSKNAAPAQQWTSTLFKYCLAWGWPGSQLNEIEISAFKRFKDCIETLNTLSIFIPRQSFEQAAKYIIQVTRDTIFHAASPPASVQVLGILEAAGIDFDKIWVSSMDNERWPPAPRLNPLLPKQLQKAHGLPHTTANRELIYCQQLIDGFSQQGKSVIFSYAKHDEDKHRNKSALIKAFPEIALESLCDLPEAHQATRNLIDYDNPKVPVLENEKISGGSRLLQLQAACPFRAFAETRLGATALPTTAQGLDAIERGLLVHQCLEKLWQQLHTRDALLKLDDNELTKLIGSITTTVLNNFLQHWPLHHAEILLELEKHRLSLLLTQWLNVEKQRPPFTVVAVEKKIQFTLGGIDLTLRIDRIDENTHQEKIIIDYKTGQSSINDWLTERPDAPQLPLYAISQEECIGIAFAQVRFDHCQMMGISAIDVQIPGLILAEQLATETDWNKLRKSWRSVLEQLVIEVQNGQHAVDPKNPVTTCQYCELPIFCRIHEML